MKSSMNEKENLTRILELQNEKSQIKIQILRDKTITKQILLLRQQELNHKHSFQIMLLVLVGSFMLLTTISYILNPLQSIAIYPFITAVALAIIAYLIMKKYCERHFLGNRLFEKVENIDKLYINEEARIRDIDKEIMALEEMY